VNCVYYGLKSSIFVEVDVLLTTKKKPMHRPIPYLRPNLIQGASIYTPPPSRSRGDRFQGMGFGAWIWMAGLTWQSEGPHGHTVWRVPSGSSQKTKHDPKKFKSGKICPEKKKGVNRQSENPFEF
jgi:hypothetical protein